MAFDQLLLSLEHLEKRLAGTKELVLGGRQFIEKELGDIEGAAQRAEETVGASLETMTTQLDRTGAILQSKMDELVAALDVGAIGKMLDDQFTALAASLDFKPGFPTAPEIKLPGSEDAGDGTG